MNKVFIFVLFALQLQAQDTIVFPKVDVFKRNILEVSYSQPLGALSDKYENSISTAFYMRTKIAKRQFIDFGVELSGIIKGKNVEYTVGDEVVLLDGSKSAFFLGFRYTRFLIVSKSENFHIESNTGIGWKYLHYSKPEGEIYEDLDTRPTLNTIGVSQGIKIMFYGFGLHCAYQYAPYDLFNSKVERNFGGSSLQYGISGSWNF